MPPMLLPTTRLCSIVTWLMEPPASEPVARIPSPVAPVTVRPSILTWLDLIVIPARHGAIPGPLGPSCSQLPFAVEDPWITAPCRPLRVSDDEMMTSSVYV